MHFHALLLDGCFDVQGTFHQAPAPAPVEVEAILARVIERAAVLLSDREQSELDQDEQALAAAYLGATVDILTARAARMRSIGVLWGFPDRAELEDAGADHIVVRRARPSRSEGGCRPSE